MIYLAAVSAVVLIAVLVLSYALMLALTERFAKERDKWAEERRELLNRIQRPEYVPRVSEPVELPERTEEQIRNDRAWAQVGEVLSIDDDYGRD